VPRGNGKDAYLEGWFSILGFGPPCGLETVFVSLLGLKSVVPGGVGQAPVIPQLSQARPPP